MDTASEGEKITSICGPSLDNLKFDERPIRNLRNYNSENMESMSGATSLPILEKCGPTSTKTDDKDGVKNEHLDHEENEDYVPDIMTSSYTEISYEQESLAMRGSDEQSVHDELQVAIKQEETLPNSPENGKVTEKRRPNSLILNSNSDGSSTFTTLESGIQNEDLISPLLTTPSASGIRNLRCCELDDTFSWSRIMEDRQVQTSASSQISIDGSPSPSSEELLSESQGTRSHGHCKHHRLHRRMGSDTSGLSELAGTLIVEGDVLSFVADDLQEKIRLSSPLSRRDSPSFPSSRVSTPSLYKQALQPHVPLVDAGALADLEAHALRVASGVDHMLENLSGTVQSISSLTVDCMETFEKSVCKTCDLVDSNIKSMYQLMAKCEELSNSMRPLYKVADEIKEIKRLVDHFENVMEHKS